MSKIFPAIIFSFLLTLVFCSEAMLQTNYPFIRNERFVVRALETIYSAQVTFQATNGTGNYGTLNRLNQENLIDSALASGDKYGYYFGLTTISRTSTTPARFYVTATPRRYGKTGRVSFYLDESGTLRGADKNGLTATVSEPVINAFVVPSPLPENERRAILNTRTIFNAQITYQATNGNFANTLVDLRNAGLINNQLATGFSSGYLFQMATTLSPATIRIWAVPALYGTTGIRSFFIDTSGVMRGADKNGSQADVNDPPIDECLELGNSNESCTISDLRTLPGAQATYQATIGGGNYGTFSQLSAAGLINQLLASGSYHGYIFTCTAFAPTATTPASFKISAVPKNYGVTGRRSFYVDESGVIRGADKNGLPADENDPPIQK